MRWSNSLVLVILFLLPGQPAGALEPAYQTVVPAVSRGAGSGGSVWQTDLYVAPVGSSPAAVTLYWLPRDQDNTFSQSVTLTLSAGRTTVYEDVLQTRFGIGSGGGALLLTSDAPLNVNAYIYNLKGGTRFGQGFEGLPVSRAVTSAMEIAIPGLRIDSGARSNFFAVAGPAGASYTLSLVSSSGATLATTSESLPPLAAHYLPLDGLVSGAPGDVSLLVDVDSGSAWVAGSRIDNASGDPFTAGAGAMVPAPASLLSQSMGTYSGSWTNMTFGSSGAATITLSQQADTVSMTIDLDGNVFGGSNPAAETFSGTSTASGVSYSGPSSLFGDVTLWSDPYGRVQGFGTGIPAAGIDSVIFSGAISPDTIALAYTVLFSGGGSADGILAAGR